VLKKALKDLVGKLARIGGATGVKLEDLISWTLIQHLSSAITPLVLLETSLAEPRYLPSHAIESSYP